MKSNHFIWPSVPLAQLCDIKIGRTPNRGKVEYWGPGYPWLSIADMDQGKDLIVTKETITQKAVDECRCYQVQPDTLLMSFKLSVGKLGFARIPMYTNEAIAALLIRHQTKILPNYLYYALQVIDLMSRTDRAVMGRTLNIEKLSLLPIPLPTLTEQKRISAILEKADRLRRQRHYTLELSNTFLQSVFWEMFGDPAENPMKWDLTELSYVCDEIYRYPTFYGFQYTEKGTPVARIGNILSDGRLNPNLSDYVFIDPEISKRFPRTILELYDIVMAVRGDGSTVSRIGIVDSSNLIGANISPNLLLFRAKKDVISPMYLFHLMVSDAGQHLLEMYITRTAKKTITAQDIKQIKIPVPRKLLQKKFAQIVQKFERLCTQQREAERQAEHLFQTLLHQAFEGNVGLGSGIVQDEAVEDGVQPQVVCSELTGSYVQLRMKY